MHCYVLKQRNHLRFCSNLEHTFISIGFSKEGGNYTPNSTVKRGANQCNIYRGCAEITTLTAGYVEEKKRGEMLPSNSQLANSG